jgi:hypothetical protein
MRFMPRISLASPTVVIPRFCEPIVSNESDHTRSSSLTAMVKIMLMVKATRRMVKGREDTKISESPTN